MADLPAIRAEDLPPINENFVEISAALGRFRAAMQALRDLLPFIGSQEASLDDTSQSQNEFFNHVIDDTPAERQPRVAAAMVDLLVDFVMPALHGEAAARLAHVRDLVHAGVTELEAGREPDPAVVAEILAFDPATITAPKQDHRDQRADVGKVVDQLVKMINAFGDVRPAMAFTFGFARHASRVSRTATLRSALVVTAVTNLEVLLSAIFSSFYREYPGALDDLDQADGSVDRLAYGEALSFANREEMLEAIIERRVEAVLRGGLSRWERWFLRNIRVGPRRLVGNWPAVAEVFHRRHLFVHTGGRVTRDYVKATNSSRIVGSSLDAPAPYVDAALDGLTVLGTMLAVHAQWRWFKAYRAVVTESAHQILYEEFMRPGIWGPVAPIYEGLLRFKLEPETIAVFSANRWLGLKRAGVLTDTHREELRQWKVGALPPIYGLVRLALLDELDELFLRLPFALATGHITHDALRTWPVFAEARADPRLNSLPGLP
jgi:hypothetical protein